ncbi:hypothetical protein BscR1v2_000740 [Bartonella schoenbuchensis R1]|uniref:Uncharacterized protein n=1 Tax=Bartonella schoenbuchensis (strain DSM 13525 / NCTC 13165 / R1) TaxID=687861 RepID=A0A1S6XNF2_BARSR|nr:hypothetical protein BscR1v2_000740 [Bartonella schoenbuchensis R1]
MSEHKQILSLQDTASSNEGQIAYLKKFVQTI